ncbi:hypothetical protein [Labilibaculum sp.]|uniref:hypothetical protein n=1 Tax=Labilibaculum sp. TaxID=2060723 RepID=UPI00356A5A9B
MIYKVVLFISLSLLLLSCNSSDKYWPDEDLGGDEKLFFNENDFIRMRSNIDQYEWAENLYVKLKEAVLDTTIYYPFGQASDWSKSFITREAAIYYRISGDTTMLPFVKSQIINEYKLQSLDQSLFKKGEKLSGFWSWGMFRMGNLAAWDLVKKHPLFQDIVPAMNQRLDEIIDRGFDYNEAITRLGNTQFLGVTTLGIAGFLRSNSAAVDTAINGSNGYKASLLRFRDKTFWPEPLKYDYGYVASAMHMLAEASKTNKLENLYRYTAANGASFKGMMDGFMSLMLTDGALPVCGDGTRYVDVVDNKVYKQGKCFFKEKQSAYRTNIKVDLLYSKYKNPEYAWLASQNLQRDAWDFNFWAWTALTHGVLLGEVKAPSAKSVAYQEFGSALLRADTTENYWGSDAISAYVRNGASLQFHSHNDHFALGITAFKKQTYFDNYLGWDYLAPRASRGNRNATPFSNTILAHNTIAIDFREPDKNVIKLARKNPEIPGAKFSEITTSGPMQILSTKGSIYNGVNQCRTIGITSDYVLDVFECESYENHNYDYILHSYGDLSFNFGLTFEAYNTLNKEYGLAKIDKVSKREDNLWLLNTQKANVDSTFKAVFIDKDSIGMCIIVAGDPETEIFSTQVPFYIKREGFDAELPSNIPKRKPALIVRRKNNSLRFIVLHVPFKNKIPRYKLMVKEDKVIIQSPEYTDEFSLNKNCLKRIKKI